MKLSHLSVLLAAQLGLAGYLWYQNNQQVAATPLLAQQEITSLTLTKGPGKAAAPMPDQTHADHAQSNATRADNTQSAMTEPKRQPDSTSVTLQQQNGRWQLNAGSAQQPLWLAASPSKMQQLLGDLQKARLTWPLADTKDSLARFTLSDDAWQWQLKLTSANGASQTLWLGDNAGFRQQYLRRDGETAVYKIALNSYELSTAAEQWLDQNLLAVQDIVQVRGADFSLRKATGDAAGWQVSGLLPAVLPASTAATDNASTPAEPSAAEALLHNLQTLRVQGYQASLSAEAEQALQNATKLTIRTQANGNNNELLLELAKAGEQYLARRSDLNAVFRIDQSTYQSLSSTNLAALRAKAPAAVASTAPPASSSQQLLKGLQQQLQPGQTAPAQATPAQATPEQAAPAQQSAPQAAKPD